jgi:hypothetical protein
MANAKVYHNCECVISSAIQLRSVGGQWSSKPDENGIKNIEVYDFDAKRRVPFVGEYISLKLIVQRKYKYSGNERVDDGLYGVEVFADIPINDFYANEKGRYQGLHDGLTDSIDNTVKEFTTGMGFTDQVYDLTITEYAKKDGSSGYSLFKIVPWNTERPPVRLNVADIKPSANTVSALQAIIAKRKKVETPSASATIDTPTKQPSNVAQDEIPFA